VTISYVRARRPLRERLMTRVITVESGCWEWTACRNNHGYGMLLGNGRSLVLAHRASYEIHVGPIGNGIQVLHVCDNPACVNPEHLRLGTTRDNMRDMVSKGRSTRGERCPYAKLTSDDVVAIRAAHGVKRRELSRRYGVSETLVTLLRQGKRWTHIAEQNNQGRPPV